jgi:hypothetical protein
MTNSMKDCFITLWQLNFPLIFFFYKFSQEKNLKKKARNAQ